MRLEIDIPEHHYNNIMAIDSISLGRTPYKGIIMYAINAIKQGKVLEQEPTTKNDLGVDCIDRVELLKAMDAWDKFGNDPNEGLIRLSTPALQDRYVPYVKYEDMVNCVKGMPPVTPKFSSSLDKNSKKLEKNFDESDCISRQAVLEQAYAYGNGLEPDGYCVNVEDIQALPPVTPQEPRKGHWVEVTYGKGGYECDICHESVPCFKHGLENFSHFCPNCGAKMVRPWESEVEK